MYIYHWLTQLNNIWRSLTSLNVIILNWLYTLYAVDFRGRGTVTQVLTRNLFVNLSIVFTTLIRHIRGSSGVKLNIKRCKIVHFCRLLEVFVIFWWTTREQVTEERFSYYILEMWNIYPPMPAPELTFHFCSSFVTTMYDLNAYTKWTP